MEYDLSPVLLGVRELAPALVGSSLLESSRSESSRYNEARSSCSIRSQNGLRGSKWPLIHLSSPTSGRQQAAIGVEVESQKRQ